MSNQTLENIFRRSQQRNIQLHRSFSVVLTTYREYVPHVVVICEYHLTNSNLPTESIHERRYPTPSTLLVSMWLCHWLIWSSDSSDLLTLRRSTP